ncbi:MAG: SAM-dependent methyltransferase [Anaerolineae bacterium]|nr:SAM-dependent methyltransferase [Anaerolineae bacterium]MDW8102506.1 SAM-dependent methyltransferase [Anaerolineae bacterium]
MRISTAKVVAAMVDPKLIPELNPLEKLVMILLNLIGPVRRAVTERWLFGQKVAVEFYKEGIRDFLVLGAGMPTAGHVHQLFPDARVLYVDKDERVVKLAQHKLAGNEKVRYIKGDLTRFHEEVLPEAKKFFGESPKLGVIMVGIIYFLPDDKVREIFKSLYGWVAPGSRLVVTNTDADAIRITRGTYLRYLIFKGLYELVGNKNYPRTDAGLRAMLLPWQVVERIPIFKSDTADPKSAVSTGYIAVKVKTGG